MSFELECAKYFNKIKQQGLKIETSKDVAKKRDENLRLYRTARFYIPVKNKIQSVGPDITSNQQLDHAVIKAYESIPKPKRELDGEYHFLMFEKNGHYYPSRYFLMPGNGGLIDYSCQLNEKVEWASVVAAGHTHPLYKASSELAINNFKNKYFSAGGPTILMARRIPLFLRTPKGKDIKVLEIRGNWLTT